MSILNNIYNAILLKEDLKGFQGKANLYRLEPPLQIPNYHTVFTEKENAIQEKIIMYVVVSYLNKDHFTDNYSHLRNFIDETFIFESDENGDVLNWTKLKGSFKNDPEEIENDINQNFVKALNNLGYTIITEKEGQKEFSKFFTVIKSLDTRFYPYPKEDEEKKSRETERFDFPNAITALSNHLGEINGPKKIMMDNINFDSATIESTIANKEFSKDELENIREVSKKLFDNFGKSFYKYFEKDISDHSMYLIDYSKNDYYYKIIRQLTNLIFGKIYSYEDIYKFGNLNINCINNRIVTKDLNIFLINIADAKYLEYKNYHNLIELFHNPNYCYFHDSILLEDFPDYPIYVRQSTLNEDVFLIYNTPKSYKESISREYESWYFLFYFEGLSKFKKLKKEEEKVQGKKEEEEESGELNLNKFIRTSVQEEEEEKEAKDEKKFNVFPENLKQQLQQQQEKIEEEHNNIIEEVFQEKKQQQNENKIWVDKDYFFQLSKFYRENNISEYSQKLIDNYKEKLQELNELEDYLIPVLSQYSDKCIENIFNNIEAGVTTSSPSTFKNKVLNNKVY
jgi:hypothetical protein